MSTYFHYEYFLVARTVTDKLFKRKVLVIDNCCNYKIWIRIWTVSLFTLSYLFI